MLKHIITALFIFTGFFVKAQEKKVTRIARLTVDSTKLSVYLQYLNEQMNAAVKLEPGAISYNVYSDKIHPNNLTIVEVYADNNAYLLHRDTPHFKKYKSATKDMVQSLELTEVAPILSANKE